MAKYKKVREPQNLEEALVIIRKQEAIIAKQAAKFEELEAKSLELSETVKLLMARIYGKKSEILTPGQTSLFADSVPEDKNSTDSNSLTETTVEEYVVRRRKKARDVRQANLDALPQVGKVYELKDKKRFCDTCGEALEIIGKHLVHREVKCKPMEFYCENSYVQTGKCQHCVNPMNGNDKLIQAMAPTPFAVHSYFSASVVAEILYNKYVLALPLNRQAQNWRALIPLSSKAMAEQVIKNAARFKPLYELLRKALSEETVIHLDETPLRVVKSERSKCYFWAASSAKEFNQHNIACFFYAASRGGEIIPQIIGPDYRGCLMCDGHSAYQQERLPNGTLGACLIHIAWKFKEIVKIGKGAKILQHSKAAEAATKLGEIFHTVYHRRRKSSAAALTS